MSAIDNPVRTKIQSGNKLLEFQEYFVKRGTKDTVINVIFKGAEKAEPAPGVIQAIEEAERIIICPSKSTANEYSWSRGLDWFKGACSTKTKFI